MFSDIAFMYIAGNKIVKCLSTYSFEGTTRHQAAMNIGPFVGVYSNLYSRYYADVE